VPQCPITGGDNVHRRKDTHSPHQAVCRMIAHVHLPRKDRSKLRLHMIINVQLKPNSITLSWSQTCNELEFGLSRIIAR